MNEELTEHFNKSLGSAARIIIPQSREPEELYSLAKEADIMVSWDTNRNLLSHCQKLKLVIIPAIGVDSQIPILREFPHLKVVNSRGNAVPTAQHAIALMLALTNRVIHFDKHMREGQWRAHNDRPPSILLEKMRVGILGTGTVGQEIIKRLEGFGVSISGCSRTGSSIPGFPQLQTFPVSDLDEFLSKTQILFVAVPKTPHTIGMLGSHELATLPDGALLINVARGPVIQEEALFDALKSQKLEGAGIDVWYNYRPEEVNGRKFPYSLPFHELDNVILSPHRASSPLTRPGRFDDVISNIQNFIAGKPLINQIDLQAGY